MSVAKCQDGRWTCKYKKDGKWKQRIFPAGSETEARAFDEEMSCTQREVHTLGSLVVSYYGAQPKHETTRRRVVLALTGTQDNRGRHVTGYAEFMRDKPAAELSRRDLEQMRQNMREHGLGNNTQNKYQAYFRAILAWAADQELIHTNPWGNFKRLPVQQKEVSVSLDDFRKLYDAMPEWLQWASKTALNLALRFGLVELFGLKWTSFDWRRGCVRVRQGKSGRLKTVFPPGAYMAEAAARYAEDRKAGREFVCSSRKGLQVQNYGKAWQTACERAGVRMRPYDIRHLAATEMLASGADLASVAAQLGHSSVTTTGRTYAHVTAGGQKRAAEYLPAI